SRGVIHQRSLKPQEGRGGNGFDRAANLPVFARRVPLGIARSPPMALNPQQVFANHILQKVVPSLQGNPWVATYVANLEANAKRFLGQTPGETLDAKTYAERTRADLAGIAAALGSNAGGDITSSLAQVAERFGLPAAAPDSTAVVESR